MLELNATFSRLREYAARALDALGGALDAGVSPLSASAALEGYDAALSVLVERGRSRATKTLQRALTIALAHANALGGHCARPSAMPSSPAAAANCASRRTKARLPRTLRPGNPLAILRANLRLSSIACRHALRCSVCLADCCRRRKHCRRVAWFLDSDDHGDRAEARFRRHLQLRPAARDRHAAGPGAGHGARAFRVRREWERIALLAVLCFGFRQLTTVHYGIGVMLLTALIVVLLTFEGMAPGETMPARALGTSIGSALALLAYVVWPTWERGPRAPGSGRYARCLPALLPCSNRRQLTRARRHPPARPQLAQRTREASLDRLRGEPGRDSRLVATAEGIFANANRFIRAAMALEAARQGPVQLPARAAVAEFAARVDASVSAIASGLRSNAAPSIDTGLRAAQRALAVAVEGAARSDDEHALAAAWVESSDRIVDSVDTLAHLMERELRAEASERGLRAEG
jgi:uncharacterized membrane protein YccC